MSVITDYQRKRWREASVRYREKNKKPCPDCKKPILNKSKYCRHCSSVRKFTGRKFSVEHRQKLAKSKIGERNSMWTGSLVGYTALHNWVRRNKAKPEVCDMCKENMPHDLANISQKYKRSIDDFEWLCRKCHMNKDGRIYNLKNSGVLR